LTPSRLPGITNPPLSSVVQSLAIATEAALPRTAATANAILVLPNMVVARLIDRALSRQIAGSRLYSPCAVSLLRDGQSKWNKAAPRSISGSQATNRSTRRDKTMSAKPVLQSLLAAALGVVTAVPAAHAFADLSARPGASAAATQSLKGQVAPMNHRRLGGKARDQVRGETDAPMRWIDNPASPGG
jgi:hypothetical protein